jgi:hypothetical protein
VTLQRTKVLFYSAALFNWGAVLILALLARPLGLPPPYQTMFGQMTLGAILVFGCGYWMVGRDPGANRGIAALGVMGKLLVVAIVLSHWLGGRATPQMAALVSADVVYALLFLKFLKQGAA